MRIQSRMKALLSEGEDMVASPYSDEKFKPKQVALVKLLADLGRMDSVAVDYLALLQDKIKSNAGAGAHGQGWVKQEADLMTDLVALLKKHARNILLHP